MSANPISCVIPVFNGECYLGETIDNVLQQTLPPFEVIVVDDGSTDNSAKIADAFGPPVRRVFQSNQGHGAARNLGLQHAKGDLIAFQDADDLWHPEKLERQLRFLQQHPGAGGCVVYVRNFSVFESSDEASAREKRRVDEAAPGFTFASLLAHRWAFERVGALDASLEHTDDTDWFLRARDAAVDIGVLTDALCFRRIHESNRSRLHADNSVDEYLQLLKRHLDKRRSGNG